MYWVCKMCGRSIRQEEKPMCCYYDRMDYIENISDEDAVKMGLDIPAGERFEFPGDVRWDPDTGKPYRLSEFLYEQNTLQDWQYAIMEREALRPDKASITSTPLLPKHACNSCRWHLGPN